MLIICQIMNDNIEISIASLQPSHRQEESFKLPKIERVPSRGPQKEVRSNVRLPSIKIDPIELRREQRSQRVLGTSEQDFVGEVQRKIRMVLQQQQIEQLEEQESDEDNFEKKIIQNKEIIKKVKRKNQKLKKENAQANHLKININVARKLSHPHKNQIHEKRIRQYKQALNQNISEQKRKDLFANNLSKQKDTNQLKQVRNLNGALKQFVSNKQISLREVKSKEETTPLNKVLQNNNKLQLKSAAEPRKLNKQLSHKILSPLQKNEQLFDAIHNYLQNPKRHDVESIQPFKLGKQKEQLQKKLRWYEQKINASACEDKVVTKLSESEVQGNKSDIKMVTSSQWAKIGVNNRGLFAQQNSSFDKQIDRINRYLQRNEQSLERYVQNQKVLVDVNLISRKPSNK